MAEEVSTIRELAADDLEELLEANPEIVSNMQVSPINDLYDRIENANEDMENLQERVNCACTRMEKLAPDDPLPAELFPEESAASQ